MVYAAERAATVPEELRFFRDRLIFGVSPSARIGAGHCPAKPLSLIGKMSPARSKILWAIENKDYRALFMEGGCQFYALALHEKLELPLFYECFPDRDVHSHVFVMKDGQCFDYEGKKELADIARAYGGWVDVPPRPLTPARIREVNQHKGLDDLEESLLTIARAEFEKRKHLYA